MSPGFGYYNVKNLRFISNWYDCRHQAELLTRRAWRNFIAPMLKAYPELPRQTEEDEWAADRALLHLEDLRDYLTELTDEINAAIRTAKPRQTIAKLRNTAGRTPEEAATALALADKLEARLAGGTS